MTELDLLKRRQLAFEFPGRYAFAIHAQVPEQVGAFFTEAGTLDQAWGKAEGRKAVIESYRERFAGFAGATHWVTNTHVSSFDGERACVQAFTLALLALKDQPADFPTLYRGEYKFELVWAGENWLIEHLTIARHGINTLHLGSSDFAPKK